MSIGVLGGNHGPVECRAFLDCRPAESAPTCPRDHSVKPSDCALPLDLAGDICFLRFEHGGRYLSTATARRTGNQRRSRGRQESGMASKTDLDENSQMNINAGCLGREQMCNGALSHSNSPVRRCKRGHSKHQIGVSRYLSFQFTPFYLVLLCAFGLLFCIHSAPSSVRAASVYWFVFLGAWHPAVLELAYFKRVSLAVEAVPLPCVRVPCTAMETR